jgi:alpha-beta hydrolase superfamily lysophospholipase
MAAMQESDFKLKMQDSTPLFVRAFSAASTPKAVVQVSHGMAEHSARYARLAKTLTERGYTVYASDHRGHGKTASTPNELGFFSEHDGWTKVVSDQIALMEELKGRHPGVPLYLFGHSMGSYIARGVALRRGEALSGLMLSGTTHDRPLAYRAPKLLVAAERVRLGNRGKSPLISKLTFEAFNAKFPSPRTGCDWLSRDHAEVDKYVEDPLCGFPCTLQLWWDVLSGLAEICTQEMVERMPRRLPIYVMAGEFDPVNNKLAGIRKLRRALEQTGMDSVTVRVYPGARHELLNEINRDEITEDLVAWLDRQTS